MSRSIITAKDLSRRYPRGVSALEGVDLDIARGEWVAVVGPSGSGKTTLLNLISGLDRPTRGRVEVLGRDVASMDAREAAVFRREHVGLVFQVFHLVPYLTALENVMLAQHYHSFADRDEAMAALARVGLEDRAHHRPSELSGGEQQRVCIARALVNDPEIVLADEPTGNLDEANARRIFELFRAIHAEGRTLVVATHDPELAALADRVIRLRKGALETGEVPASPGAGAPAPDPVEAVR